MQLHIHRLEFRDGGGTSHGGAARQAHTSRIFSNFLASRSAFASGSNKASREERLDNKERKNQAKQLEHGSALSACINVLLRIACLE